MTRWATAAAVGMLAVLETGCLVEMAKVQDPRPVFDQARKEAARVAGRPGRASQVNVLVYDPKDQQLIRVSVPMWLAKKFDRHVEWDEDEAPGGGAEATVRRATRRIRLDDIAKTGAGTFVEVDEEDGEQVLVWLK